MRKNLLVISIVLLSFIIYYFLNKFFLLELIRWFKSFLINVPISYLAGYLVVGIPLLIVPFLISRSVSYADSVGINRNPLTGIIFAAICTIPMFAGYWIFMAHDKEISSKELFIIAFAAPFIEEIFYRGIIFGQIYRYSKAGFITAVLISAILFAAGHIKGDMEFMTVAGVFIITLLGGGLFSWLYAEWNFNLWVPVFLHMFMNLAWLIFAAGENATGGLSANIFRAVTIVIAILATIYWRKKYVVRW